MPIDVKKFELDRIVNMLQTFGWNLRSSSFEGDKVIITIEKTVTPER